MSREIAIIFDDGSIESKVLQFELKTSYDINVVKVQPYKDLDIWLAEILGKTDQIQKIFLHFPIEDYIQKSIRDEIMAAEKNYPKLRIIAWYEQAPRSNIRHRAANYGIPEWTEKHDKIVKEYEATKPEEIKLIASDIIREIDERKPYVDKTYPDFNKPIKIEEDEKVKQDYQNTIKKGKKKRGV